jgi:hypothetical protein
MQLAKLLAVFSDIQIFVTETAELAHVYDAVPRLPFFYHDMKRSEIKRRRAARVPLS